MGVRSHLTGEREKRSLPSFIEEKKLTPLPTISLFYRKCSISKETNTTTISLRSLSKASILHGMRSDQSGHRGALFPRRRSGTSGPGRRGACLERACGGCTPSLWLWQGLFAVRAEGIHALSGSLLSATSPTVVFASCHRER